MEIIRTAMLFLLLVVSGGVIIRFFVKIKMKAAAVAFGIFFITVSAFALLYCVADVLSQSLKSIYHADSVMETFFIMEIEWLSVPLTVFKTFTVGSLILTLAVIFSVVIISAKAAKEIYAYFKTEKPRTVSLTRSDKNTAHNAGGELIYNGYIYLKFGHLRN